MSDKPSLSTSFERFGAYADWAWKFAVAAADATVRVQKCVELGQLRFCDATNNHAMALR